MRRIPLGFMGGSFSDVTVEGRAAEASDPQGVGLNYVGPDYATTLAHSDGVGPRPVGDDLLDRPRVAVINETMARIYWKDREPIGGRFMFGVPQAGQEPQWITVVGVSRDIKQRTLTERPQASAAIPILQFYASSAVLMVRAQRRIRVGERRVAAGGP